MSNAASASAVGKPDGRRRHAGQEGPPLAWQAIERAFDPLFGSANPWRHLGALAFFFFSLAAASGAYLYIVLDTSVAGVYRSIDGLAAGRLAVGAVIRSLHRYAADAFILTSVLHLGREFLCKRYGGFRTYSWLVGVPLLGLAYASGLSGFWLKWDALAQFAAVATAEWLDALPFFATPVARNFLSIQAVSDRLFSLFVFIHIGVPLLALMALWLHLLRISRPRVWPPRSLATGTFVMLLVLSIAFPAGMEAPADPATAPLTLAIDWFYLFWQPLMYATTPATVWLLVAGLTALLLLLPYTARKRQPAAVVDPAHCNGCRRCLNDCPYAAIAMVPHPNPAKGRQLAQVNADACASCGLCFGACPTATPWRTGTATGIALPHESLAALRQELDAKLATLAGGVMIFGCRQGAGVGDMARPGLAGMELSCAGMLPPSFIDYALRRGAGQALLVVCRGCAYRTGDETLEERLAGKREPQLRARVDRARLALCRADRGEEKLVAKMVAELSERRLPAVAAPGLPTPGAAHG